jgi:signal transduction histidine kinase
VNNSVKHAGATTISAQSNLQETDWTILLQDDGSGFDLDKAQTEEDRYGLKNIQERALAGEFSCRIASERGKGTLTTLQISHTR